VSPGGAHRIVGRAGSIVAGAGAVAPAATGPPRAGEAAAARGSRGGDEGTPGGDATAAAVTDAAACVEEEEAEAEAEAEEADAVAAAIEAAAQRRRRERLKAEALSALESAQTPRQRALLAWRAADVEGTSRLEREAAEAGTAAADEQSRARDGQKGRGADEAGGAATPAVGGPAAQPDVGVAEAAARLGLELPGGAVDAVGALLRGHGLPSAVAAAMGAAYHGARGAAAPPSEDGPLPSRQDVVRATDVVKRQAAAAEAGRAEASAALAAARRDMEVCEARVGVSVQGLSDLAERRQKHFRRLASQRRLRGIGEQEQSRLEARHARRRRADGPDAEGAGAAAAPGRLAGRPVDRLAPPSQRLAPVDGALSAEGLCRASLCRALVARSALLAAHARAGAASEPVLALRALGALVRAADDVTVSAERGRPEAAPPAATAAADASSSTAPADPEPSTLQEALGAVARHDERSDAARLRCAWPGAEPHEGAATVQVRLSGGGRSDGEGRPSWVVVLSAAVSALVAAEAEAEAEAAARSGAGGADESEEATAARDLAVRTAVAAEAARSRHGAAAASALWAASIPRGGAPPAQRPGPGALPFPAPAASPRLPSWAPATSAWLSPPTAWPLSARVDGAVALRFGVATVAPDMATGAPVAADVSFASRILHRSQAAPFLPGTGPDRLAAVLEAHEERMREQAAAGHAAAPMRLTLGVRAGSGTSGAPSPTPSPAGSDDQGLGGAGIPFLPSRALANAAAARAAVAELSQILLLFPPELDALVAPGVTIVPSSARLLRADGLGEPAFPVVLFLGPDGSRSAVASHQPFLASGLAVDVADGPDGPVCVQVPASSRRGGHAVARTSLAARAARAATLRHRIHEAELAAPGLAGTAQSWPSGGGGGGGGLHDRRAGFAGRHGRDDGWRGHGEAGPSSWGSASPAYAFGPRGRGASVAESEVAASDEHLASLLSAVRPSVPASISAAAQSDSEARAAAAKAGRAAVPCLRPLPAWPFVPRDRLVSRPGRWTGRSKRQPGEAEAAGRALAAVAAAELSQPALSLALGAALRPGAAAAAAPAGGDQPLDEALDELGGPAWTPAEVLIFLDRFLQFPKDFSRIASSLPRRRAADCAGLYYHTKHRAGLKAALREYRAGLRRRDSKPVLRLAAECAARLGVAAPQAWLQGRETDVTRSVPDAVPCRIAPSRGPYAALAARLTGLADGPVRMADAGPVPGREYSKHHDAHWKAVFGSSQRITGPA